ncbi:helix-turn-helix transcriptional regulator [Kitasatospora sp. NPDC052896]|uniref:helix-turn-helix transcriptional regulator n=1 Tax=Kitasatospora sp. NPDC052896 TaxID=3364061 RepID=UPI0037C575DC
MSSLISPATAAATASSATAATPAAPAVPHAADVRRQELSAFLRSRRERISPEQVGLPKTGRRRTPGLRREEVAQLAAVGVTWYTWLEQGRDIQVSVQVLDSVARALMLDPNERKHLFTLAGAGDPAPTEECPVVTPAIKLVLDQLEPYPACVLNSRFDVLAYNRAYDRVLGLSELPYEDRNLIWLIFTNQQYQSRWVDLESARTVSVARLRAAMADYVDDPAWKALLARLRQASPDFEAAWQRHEVAARDNGSKGFLHPEVGLLRLDFTNFWLSPQPGRRLVAYTPMDDETRERLQRLAAADRAS